jgi:hypothetical protein
MIRVVKAAAETDERPFSASDQGRIGPANKEISESGIANR